MKGLEWKGLEWIEENVLRDEVDHVISVAVLWKF